MRVLFFSSKVSMNYTRRLKFVLGELGRAALKKTIPDIPVKKRIAGYGPFYLDNKFIFSNFSGRSSAHNKGLHALVRDSITATTILDIGAHVGLTVLPMSIAGELAKKIYAFEASQVNCDLLERHIRLNSVKNVELVEKLVLDINHRVEFYELDTVSAMNSVVAKSVSDDYRPREVDTLTIDSFCEERKVNPDLIKIDVEGAELMVLKGAPNVLSRCRPIIYLSVHPRHLKLGGQTVQELREYLENHDYQVTDPASDVEATGDLVFSEYRVVPRELC
jgi:FkbM family methyltransferase